MSIYRGWRPLCADVEQQDVVHKRAPENASTNTPPPLHLRRARPVLILLPRTSTWIVSLPERVRPRALARRFARIANLICAAWDDPPACRKYFDELLVDKRTNRQGFPVTVLRELHDLRAYYIGIQDALMRSRDLPK
jgi:hypothetical protein